MTDKSLELTRFDWDVKKTGAYINDATGFQKRLENKHFMVRDDNYSVLGGVVTDMYAPLTNKLFESIVYEFESSGCKVISYGEWMNGGIIWVQMSHDGMPSEVIGGLTNDKVKSTVLLTTGHGGLSPLKVMATTIRVVCWNTFLTAVSTGDRIATVTHKGDAVQKVYECKTAINELCTSVKDIYANFNRLSEVKVTERFVDKFARRVLSFPDDYTDVSTRKLNQHETMLTYFNDGNNNLNLWGAFNMVTGYVDHHLNNTTDGLKTKFAVDSKYAFSHKSLLGSGHHIKASAYKLLMGVSNNA